jgi:phosphoglycerol transferase MdoB-like AlkP superfamily enzyme
MNHLFERRYGTVYLFFVLFACVSAITRLALTVKALPFLEPGLWIMLKTFSVGFFYDLVTASYISIPFILYLLLLPDRIFKSWFHKPVVYLAYFATIYALLYGFVAEWLFWDEFSSRFNFIAVDYLIYTREVIGNIRESYPLNEILGALFVSSIIVFMLIRKKIDLSLKASSRFSHRLRHAIPLLFAPVLAFMLVDTSLAHISSNRYENELAGNGIYNFWAAFNSNEIDYDALYLSEDQSKALSRLHNLVATPNAVFDKNNSSNIKRHISTKGSEKKLNVVMIVVESLSADFMGTFGNQLNITPRLDALARDSMVFTNLFATGTRTVRGMEAITLSIPPTPGRSIVKRPHNEGLFSSGHVFHNKGYATRFIYGGYGYFDNMNHFFSSNDFNIVDRTDVDDSKIHYSNIWGIADEDLFAKVLEENDKLHNTGKPFYEFIMTTSNHRPYTYPEGRIDIPSHTSREGAVKYTDYAIGKFIDDARKQPWFDDTVFVIIADHTASSAGSVDLDVEKYRIPMLIYSPKYIKHQVVNTMASQIDVTPTVLALLNFDYDSLFFGRDILTTPEPEARALIGNYQKLGYLKGDKLTVLGTKKTVEQFDVDFTNHTIKPTKISNQYLQDALAYYEGASLIYKKKLDRVIK